LNGISVSTWKNGIKRGLDTTWSLSKIIFPVTLIVSMLKFTPLIGLLTKILEPVMVHFGLYGDSAIVLVLGNVLNLYAAVGAMLTMQLTVKQVFILAIMLSFSHNLIVETAITTRIGVKPWVAAILRLSLAFVFAFLFNLIWNGGQTAARYGLIPVKDQVLHSWPDIFINGVHTAFLGILQVAVIVIPVMIMIQILKDINILPLLAKLLSPYTRVLGVSDKTGVTLLAGILFGIAYGAGVIVQTAKEENLSKKDLYLVSIFLVSCHAVIEDTLIFIPLGINVLPLLFMRISLAFVVTVVTAGFWKKVDQTKALSELI